MDSITTVFYFPAPTISIRTSPNLSVFLQRCLTHPQSFPFSTRDGCLMSHAHVLATALPSVHGCTNGRLCAKPMIQLGSNTSKINSLPCTSYIGLEHYVVRSLGRWKGEKKEKKNHFQTLIRHCSLSHLLMSMLSHG